jgi:hypothetical protein
MLVGGGIVFVFLRIGSIETESAAVEAPDGGAASPSAGATKRRRRAPGSADGDQPAPTLTEADLKTATEGDSLRVRERTLDLASGEEARDLLQDEIDNAIAGRSEELTACVVQARGAAQISGRVVFGMVVGPSGNVTQARVEAPAFLIKNGLYRCARPKLLSVRYPAAGKDTVVRVSFDLE